MKYPVLPCMALIWLLLPGRALSAKLSEDQLSRLRGNEILYWYWKDRKTNTGTGKAMGIIDARPEQVFKVLTDVTRFAQWMERVEDPKITKREGRTYDFYYRIDMPWPLDDQWCLTRNVNFVDEKRGIYKRKWSLIKGTFHRNDGYWYMERFDGDKTLVTYWCRVQPKTMVPEFVINFVIKKSLPRSIRRVRERVTWLRRNNEL